MKLVVKSICILLYCVLQLTGQSNFEFGFSLPHPYREKYIDSVFIRSLRIQDTVGAFNNIIEIQKLAQKHKDDIMLMAVEVFKLRTNPIKDSIGLVQRAKAFDDIIWRAGQKKYYSLQIITADHIGAIMSAHQKTGKALYYYSRAFELFPLVEERYIPKVAVIGHYLARLFYGFGDYDKAIYFTSLDRTGPKENHYSMLVCDLLSAIYLKKGMYDSSYYYIQQAERIFPHVKDSNVEGFNGWRGIFLGNYGKIAFYQHKFQDAIPLFKQSIEITNASGLYSNVSVMAILLAKSYIHTSDFDSARDMLPIIFDALHRTPDEAGYIEYYKLLLSLDLNHLSISDKMRLFDSIDGWTAKLNEKYNKNIQIQTELQQDISNKKELEYKLQQKIDNQMWYRRFLLGLMAVMVLLAWLIINRNHIQLRLQRRKTIEAEEKAKTAIEQAKEELEEFKKAMLEKTKYMDALENEKNQHIEHELLNLKENSILTDSDWFKFKQLFESVHHGYLSRLMEKYPLLSPGEQRLFVLIKMGLSTFEKASILGVSNGAIRTMKSRLLKKLKLEPETNLEEIAKSI